MPYVGLRGGMLATWVGDALQWRAHVRVLKTCATSWHSHAQATHASIRSRHVMLCYVLCVCVCGVCVMCVQCAGVLMTLLACKFGTGVLAATVSGGMDAEAML